MRKGYRVTLLMITAGLLILPGYITGPQRVNSAQVTTAQQRHHQRGDQKIRIGHTIYLIKRQTSAVDRLSEAQIQTDCQQLKARTLHDVQAERAENLSPSIHLNRKLNHLAAIRARQVAKRFSHYSRNHRPMTTVDAHRAHLSAGFQAAENIASAGLGNCTVVGDPKVYHNHNGRDMADMSNDGMMHYDALENNGHRKNILSSDDTLIGIGAAYNRRKHQFYLAEDFGNRDPRSSADVNKEDLKFHLKPAHQLTTVQKAWKQIGKWSVTAYHRVLDWLARL